jgi:hypothetical protein
MGVWHMNGADSNLRRHCRRLQEMDNHGRRTHGMCEKHVCVPPLPLPPKKKSFANCGRVHLTYSCSMSRPQRRLIWRSRRAMNAIERCCCLAVFPPSLCGIGSSAVPIPARVYRALTGRVCRSNRALHGGDQAEASRL